MQQPLAAWNPWWTSGTVPPTLRGRRRNITDELAESIDMRHVFVLSGMRRSGKTTILYQLVDELLARGTDPRDIVFVNLEDPAFDDIPLSALFSDPFDRNKTRRRYIILDEIQTRPGWERHILPPYERKEPIKFIVSGSSADLARGKHATLLTGRNLEWAIRPLDFHEFSAFHRDETSRPGAPPLSQETLFDAHYLAEGGLPETQQVPPSARRGLLQQYFDQILARDIARHENLDLNTARTLALYLAETFARPHTRRALAQAVGIGSLDTLDIYLAALRRVYLIDVATRASASPKPGLAARSPLKFYWTDIGLRNALSKDPARDRGRQAENVVAMTLATRHDQLSYWKSDAGHAEVDFVVTRSDGRMDAYQVWYDRESGGGLESVPEREWAGFQALWDAQPRVRRGTATLLTATTEGVRDGVQAVPIARWLQDR